MLSLTMESLRNNGIYLMDDAINMYILVGSGVKPEILKNLLGVEEA